MKSICQSKTSVHKLALTIVFCLITGSLSVIAKPGIRYNVSIDNPASHILSVSMRYDDITAPFTDLKMAVWTPGYYWIENYPKNVSSFNVSDENGRTLSWEKTAKNIWHINTDGVKSITVTYEVFANNHSVADPFLDETHAFIAPAGLFIYPDGKLKDSPEITFNFPDYWKTISTGLDPDRNRPNTFTASDFDVLFDCPVLIGNQDVISFEVDDVPHSIAVLLPEDYDKEKLVADYTKMIESAVAIVGDMPYEHYSFLFMGPGGGGLEHLNSMAVFTGFRGGSIYPKERRELQGWMSFIAHEFFHLYNIKAIRPIALGPFDYDRENYTNMLWVSEGFTVYYEYLILNRAGFMNRDEVLQSLKNNILSYESVPGHKVQSATQSSFDTWIQFFDQSENSINTTISYYDKGCALGLLLDLKIRNETQNGKSLDDVMRYLYFKYFRDLKRGFTDAEFRQVCEKMAGCDLSEIFRYASSTDEIDYGKYFEYAGLTIDDRYKVSPGSFTGMRFRDSEDGLAVTGVEAHSPAFEAGIAPDDIIAAIDGRKVNKKELQEILLATAPGSNMVLSIVRNGQEKAISIITGKNMTRSFNIGYLTNITPLQKDILEDLFRQVD